MRETDSKQSNRERHVVVHVMEKARQGRGKSWEQEMAVFILERLSGSQGLKEVREQTVCLSGQEPSLHWEC